MDDEYDEKVIACKKLHNKARYMRGRFLNSVAVIEHELTVILTEYFCTFDERKRELFFSKVAGKLTLEKKKVILTQIMQSDYPTYWEEYKGFLKDITKIQEFRNKLAHSILDVSDEALTRPLEEGIGLIQWNKGEPITDEVFSDWEVRTTTVHSTLQDIKHLLPYKENS